MRDNKSHLRYHAVSVKQLEIRQQTKAEVFKDYPHRWDGALPQVTRTNFSNWCKVNRPAVTYDMIVSTSVWAYPPKYKHQGMLVTCCTEVANAYMAYLRRAANNDT